MNRKKTPDTRMHPQQPRLDVHRTLARVPTVRQNTADDSDNDTLGNCHRADVRRPTPHGTGSVKAGNACMLLEQKLETSKWKTNDKIPKP